MIIVLHLPEPQPGRGHHSPAVCQETKLFFLLIKALFCSLLLSNYRREKVNNAVH